MNKIAYNKIGDAWTSQSVISHIDQLLISYIDAKQAFDSVNRSCLWYKVTKAGVNGTILSAMQLLYENV
jgi:hypothetical protein